VATLRFQQTTTATPEQFVAGLTDFGPGRKKLFVNSADGYLKVHSQSAGHADVTEGSMGVWERLTYDWSDPDRVVLTTTDSNVWGGASGHTYTLKRLPDGKTSIDVVVVREAKNLKGRLLELGVAAVGKRKLTKDFAKTVKAIEAREGT
jgi:hypothetical protein